MSMLIRENVMHSVELGASHYLSAVGVGSGGAGGGGSGQLFGKSVIFSATFPAQFLFQSRPPHWPIPLPTPLHCPVPRNHHNSKLFKTQNKLKDQLKWQKRKQKHYIFKNRKHSVEIFETILIVLFSNLIMVKASTHGPLTTYACWITGY